MWVKSDNNPELYDLSTVAVAIFSDAPETRRQRANVLNAGALEITSSEDLETLTRQKLAIIFDQDTPPETTEGQVARFEKFIQKNPESSVRFLFLHWDQQREMSDRERFESINIDQISANDFPAIINKILYKARLPLFLRKGYHVEISDSLEQIEWVTYRPITLYTYKWAWKDGELEYVTEHLYIHEKKLYLYKPQIGQLQEIGEDGMIYVRINGSKIPATLVNLSLLKQAKNEE